MHDRDPCYQQRDCSVERYVAEMGNHSNFIS
jgi:hypothetical protein